jgi:hypothetical protein
VAAVRGFAAMRLRTLTAAAIGATLAWRNVIRLMRTTGAVLAFHGRRT